VLRNEESPRESAAAQKTRRPPTSEIAIQLRTSVPPASLDCPELGPAPRVDLFFGCLFSSQYLPMMTTTPDRRITAAIVSRTAQPGRAPRAGVTGVPLAASILVLPSPRSR
jgi:hypothetical protein